MNSHATGGSSQKGADSSSRRGDLTLRKPHYQTGAAGPVNTPIALFIPSINRNKLSGSDAGLVVMPSAAKQYTLSHSGMVR
jgi:hypothetical protein